MKKKIFNVFVIGHSHMGALLSLKTNNMDLFDNSDNAEFIFIRFLPLLNKQLTPHTVETDNGTTLSPSLDLVLDKFLDSNETSQHFKEFGAYNPDAKDIIISFIGGSAYNIVGIIEHDEPFDFIVSKIPDLPLKKDYKIIPESVLYEAIYTRTLPHLEVFRGLASKTTKPIFHVSAPPVIRDNEKIRNFLPANLSPKGKGIKITDPVIRKKLWILNAQIYSKECAALGAIYIPHSNICVDSEDFLLPSFQHPEDAVHANSLYVKEILKRICKINLNEFPRKYAHPYKNLPKSSYWRTAMVEPEQSDVDPVCTFELKINNSDKIITAGSCFAQHIARYLKDNGYNYLITEKPHEMFSEELAIYHNYNLFSARYGNIYTVAQLNQLFDRAYGNFVPIENVWQNNKGQFIDPHRPTIQPNGFLTSEDMERSRREHLSCVKQAFEEADIFIFTLGLTEAYVDVRDNTVFPVCPGVSGGAYSNEKFTFKNFTKEEIVNDFNIFYKKLLKINNNIKIILTVSPVPLSATAEDKHVLVSTIYSKSVLRVAAEEICNKFKNIYYFPSYEIIVGNHSRGDYFEEDLRGVNKNGVDHVMKLFFKHATTGKIQKPATENKKTDLLEDFLNVVCEEELLGECCMVDKKR